MRCHGGKVVAQLLLAIVLMVLCPVGSGGHGKPLCSSLDGPFCLPMNGRLAPAHSNGVSMSSKATANQEHRGGRGASGNIASSVVDKLLAAVAASPRGSNFHAQDAQEDNTASIKRLVQEMADKLTDQIDDIFDDLDIDIHVGSERIRVGGKKKPPFQAGIFEMYGRYDPWVDQLKFARHGFKFSLFPKQWVLKPGPEWIMVGIDGTLWDKEQERRNSLSPQTLDVRPPEITLRGSLIDQDGKLLEGCSELTAELLKADGLPLLSVKEIGPKTIFKDSLWRGRYTCGGVLTELTLEFSSQDANGQKLPAGEVSADFEFVVRREAENVVFVAAHPDHSQRESTKLTQAGCECAFLWEERVETSGGKSIPHTFFKGSCGNPLGRERYYCKVRPSSCKASPAGKDWDYCVADWRTAHRLYWKKRTGGEKSFKPSSATPPIEESKVAETAAVGTHPVESRKEQQSNQQPKQQSKQQAERQDQDDEPKSIRERSKEDAKEL